MAWSVRAHVVLRWLVVMALFGVIATANPVSAQSPAAQPVDQIDYVKLFDFNERPLGNYEETPMYWTRLSGDGFPSFSRGRFDDELGHDAPPSFRFDLKGGNIAYEYGLGDLVVFPDSDYLIEGYIRTEGLQHARAFVACYQVDRYGVRIDGSERISELHGGGASEWQAIRVHVPVDSPRASSMRLQLWALQRHVWQPVSEYGDPVDAHRQDVDACVWFDELGIRRLPRVRLSLTNPGAIVPPGSSESFVIRAHNATLRDARLVLAVHGDECGVTEVAARDLPSQGTETWEVPVPPMKPGYYNAVATLSVNGEALLLRSLRFAVLPALEGVPPRARTMGVDIDRWTHCKEDGALALVSAIGCGAARVGVPMTGSPADDRDWEYLRQIRDFSRNLAVEQIATTAIMLAADRDETGQVPQSSWRMVSTDPRWEDRVGPVFAYFGGYLLSWQLGLERLELREPGGWTSNAIALIEQRLSQYVAAPELVIPRSVLDAAPSTYLAGPRPDGSMPARHPCFAETYWLPEVVPARSIPWQLSFWQDAKAERPGTPARWLALEYTDDDRPYAERVRDLARRVVLAAAVNPNRLYVPAPFEVTETSGVPAWQPSDLYIPVRTLFRHLGGQRAVASLSLERDGVALLFSGRDHHTLVLWTWEEPAEPVWTDLYLGNDARAVRLSGEPVELERHGPKLRVPLQAEPLILRMIDVPLLLLQDSVRLDPAYIQLHETHERPVLRMENAFETVLSGTMTLRAPAAWQLEPESITIALKPGEVLEQPLSFTIPPRQLIAEQALGVDMHLEQPRLIDLHFDLKLEILLRDIVVHTSAAWDGDDLLIHQSLRNLSDGEVSFNAFCQALNRPLIERLFLSVPSGDVRVQEYRIPGARDLDKSKLWLGIREIGGPRRLDQLVEVPE